MDEMPSPREGYFRVGEIPKKVFVLYVITLLVVSFSPMVCLSEIPEITVDLSPNTNYTNRSYVNISVSVSDTEDVSSFINWNDSLVGYWNFEHVNGSSTVLDNSSYENNASCIGNRNASNNRTDGKYGQGFYFNGSGQGYLNVSDDISLDIQDEITIEAWIKEYETTFNWTFGWEDDEYGYCVEQTNDGGYIVVGESNYSDTDSSSGDILLVRLDSSGNRLWDKTLGWNQEDVGRDIRETSDGGYIITGMTNCSSQSTGDVYWFKTDSSGNRLWHHNLGWKDVKDIESIVNSMIESGYKPIMGLVQIEGNKFAQAMVYDD